MAEPTPAPRDDDDQSTPQDPLAAAFANMMNDPDSFDPATLAAAFPGGPAAFGAAMAQMQQMMSNPTAEPVNWESAEHIARQVTASEPDPMPGGAEIRQMADLVNIATPWLDQATDFADSATLLKPWSRAEWVAGTMPTWREVTGPIAGSVADAMAAALSEQAQDGMSGMPGMAGMGDLSGLLAGASGMLRQIGGSVFGMQAGHAIGALAKEVLCTTEIGLPLTETAALLPTNIKAFCADLEVPASDVMLFLALRELAHQRLFHAVSWLKPHLLEAVSAYASGISVDTDGISSAMSGIDPTNPEAIQAALSDGLLSPTKTPAQQAALERLELMFSLIEGWVDHVSFTAAEQRMPNAQALRELMRRRRAAGGPAEKALGSMVGLELRPRRLRDAAAVWAQLDLAGSVADRDSLWEHPDLLPDLASLDDPIGTVEQLLARRSDSAEFDAELQKLLDGPSGPSGTPDTTP